MRLMTQLMAAQVMLIMFTAAVLIRCPIISTAWT